MIVSWDALTVAGAILILAIVIYYRWTFVREPTEEIKKLDSTEVETPSEN